MAEHSIKDLRGGGGGGVNGRDGRGGGDKGQGNRIDEWRPLGS
jgi:hypothetical protein